MGTAWVAAPLLFLVACSTSGTVPPAPSPEASGPPPSSSTPPEPPASSQQAARPLRIAFAGEHLAGEMSALMEGAIRSGRSAAATVLG